HACHSTMREVEALHERLREWFEDEREPRLQPHEVLVMTPDIESYAPLIEAVFDRPREVEGFIPYRVADRALRRQSPVADAFLKLLELPGTRVNASQVMDFLALGPVHERFGISDEELEQVIDWVGGSGIRWGIDADHREAHGQPPYKENTWRFGLDRLLLGYAMPGDERALFGDVLPFDEVEGGLALLVGKLADFCDRLFAALRALEQGPRTLPVWRDLLSATLDELLVSTSDTAWEHELVRETLSELAEDAERARFGGRLELSTLASELAAGFDLNPEPKGFLSGQLTFCAMVPLRNIPFRVVCLLGMDDGAFPRSPPQLAFDQMHDKPRRGDRTPRESDRQLFLEAILAARERTIITFSGQSPHDNTELPPSVVVSELIDALSGAFRIPGARDGEDPRDAMVRHVVVRHPLQPFSPLNFGGSEDPRLFSYSGGYLEGARALHEARLRPPPFWVASLPEPEGKAISFEDLERFYDNPTRGLLESRLRLRLRQDEATIDDREPLELDALQKWAVASPLVERALQGEDLRSAYPQVRASGVLPLGTPGECLFQDLVADVTPLARAVSRLCEGEGLDSLELDLRLGEGGETRVQGSVEDLWPRGLVMYRYARLKARYLLRLWINHLALCCHFAGGEPKPSWLVVRGEGGRAAVYRLEPVAEAEARFLELVRLMEGGQRAPLLFFPESSWAYAGVARTAPADPEVRAKAQAAAQGVWQGGHFATGDGQDLSVRRVFGDRSPLAQDFSFDETPIPSGSGFHELAMTIYEPLVLHLEEVKS
ncbi:MAG: exodeoxyribonuclease V subunit gamma, partial [Gammaproteobacteria bacterium]|nr:exodeoxyribonuclease V subunit gamma [Gammaproteobacteria bacterium]